MGMVIKPKSGRPWGKPSGSIAGAAHRRGRESIGRCDFACHDKIKANFYPFSDLFSFWV
jgi:hypothetical protein